MLLGLSILPFFAGWGYADYPILVSEAAKLPFTG